LHSGDLVDEALGLVGIEFKGIPKRPSAGAAMNASEVTGLGGLPDGDERPLM
jgi:hypothetical protein